MNMFLSLIAALLMIMPAAHAQTIDDRGPIDGLYRTYDSKGKLQKEENFRNKKYHGEVKVYYSSGVLKSIYHYTDNVRDGEARTYYDNGGVEYEMYFFKGAQDGAVKHYYDTGELENVSTYVNGNLTGESKTYYKSGNIKQQAVYLKGLLDGIILNFSEEGALVSEESYKSGNLLMREVYKTPGLLKLDASQKTPELPPIPPKVKSEDEKAAEVAKADAGANK